RLLVGRPVDVGGRVERHQIGVVAGREETAVVKPENARRLGARPLYGAGERQDVLLKYVFVKELRKGAVLSRMPLTAVGAGDDERLAHEVLDVALVHVE